VALVIKNAQRTFNADAFMRALASAGLPIASVTWAGFQRVGEHNYEPFATATRVVGYSSEKGEDIAAKGDLRFLTSRDLTPADDQALEALITGHDPAVKSPSQVESDVDDADLAFLAEGLKDWPRVDQAVALEKVARLLVRRFQTVTVSTLRPR
jgi:hypothetical protein